MEYIQLGNTGLRVSVAGLGCGGSSKLGLALGKSDDDAVAIINQAIDLGVNFLDTAATYGTEAVVGKALRQQVRDQMVVSTKTLIKKNNVLLTAEEVSQSLEQSLRNLATDYVDVFHLHAVTPAHYDYALQELVPVLERERARGKLRFIGITESPPNDASQTMLQQAVHDDCWDVFMLGFHMMNQKAREKVFPQTQQKNIGTLLMFVVRSIFSVPGRLQSEMRALAAAGLVPEALAAKEQPLDFLLHPDGAASVIDAAYRYARHEPGAEVILFGTSSAEHLRTNIASILSPPLPVADHQRLGELFGNLEGIGLDLPTRQPQKAG